MSETVTEIFIPARNAAEFIGEAIESALGQTDGRVRVVVVDNASTDDTLRIAERYAADARLEVFRNPTDIGMTANFRRCAELHAGGYFTILCADNVLKPHFVERLRGILETNPSVDVVSACTETLQMPERQIVGNSVRPGEEARLLTPEEIIEQSFLCFNAFLVKPGAPFGFDPAFAYAPDEKLWREWAVGGVQIAYLPEVVAAYRSHTVNMGKVTPFGQQLDEQLAAIEWIEQDGRFPQFADACRRGKIHVCEYLASVTHSPHEQKILARLGRQYQAPAGAGSRAAVTATPRPAPPPRVAVLGHRPDPATLSAAAVTYQAAQFLHLEKYALTSWLNSGNIDGPQDAVIVYDESALFADERLWRFCEQTKALLVYVASDWWCHPAQTAQLLRRQKRALMVLRHESARRIFDDLVPEIPKTVQRPGVETGIFHPSGEPKKYDILLSGSETPDYPMRRTLNRLVRDNAARCGWNVLDMAREGMMSTHVTGQCAYAPALASAKVSPTGTNRGGGQGATLVTQHLDHSTARAQTEHPFFGLSRPDVFTRHYDTAGITPRYLESMASKTLLVGDLPEGEAERWYADKMVAVSPEMSDDTILSVLDYVIRDDTAREQLCDYAFQAVRATETSDHVARDLATIIAHHL